MQEYRAYVIGPDGHIIQRFDMVCTDVEVFLTEVALLLALERRYLPVQLPKLYVIAVHQLLGARFGGQRKILGPKTSVGLSGTQHFAN